MPTERIGELLERLNEARQEYRRAVENDRQVDLLLDLGKPYPGGTATLRETKRVRSLATEAYINALTEFTDYIAGEESSLNATSARLADSQELRTKSQTTKSAGGVWAA